MQGHLTQAVKTVRCANATAAGTTAINGSVIDLTKVDSVRGIALLGALTATQVTGLKWQQGTAANGSDMADVANVATANAADADSNKMLILDVSNNNIDPTKQYGRFVVTRGTANAVLDGLIAELYGVRSLPQSADTTVSAQALK
jgi:hypothetical protein